MTKAGSNYIIVTIIERLESRSQNKIRGFLVKMILVTVPPAWIRVDGFTVENADRNGCR